MSTITRRLPISNPARNAALTEAKIKKDSSPPSGNILTADTTIRLDTMQPAYALAMNEVDAAQAAYSNNTVTKNIRVAGSRMMNSHFIQVFNFAVERGEAPTGDRAYFGLDVSTGNLPEMITDAQVIAVATKLISGNVLRLAAGGVAMSMPTIVQVTTAHAAANTAVNTQSNLKDLLDENQEVVDALNTEADKLIKRMWAEIEARYAEETIESRRENAREWGVVYVTIGTKTKINIHVTDSVTLEPIAGALCRLQSADLELNTDIDGNATFNTAVVGDETLHVTAPGYVAALIPLTIIEGEEQTNNVEMVTL